MNTQVCEAHSQLGHFTEAVQASDDCVIGSLALIVMRAYCTGMHGRACLQFEQCGCFDCPRQGTLTWTCLFVILV
jgi:hypothetical protein